MYRALFLLLLGLAACGDDCEPEDWWLPSCQEEEYDPPPPGLEILEPSHPDVVRALDAVGERLGAFDAAVAFAETASLPAAFDAGDYQIAIAADGSFGWPGTGTVLTAVGAPGDPVRIGSVHPLTGAFPDDPPTALVIVDGDDVFAEQWPANWAPEYWRLQARRVDGRLVGTWRRWRGKREIARAELD